MRYLFLVFVLFIYVKAVADFDVEQVKQEITKQLAVNLKGHSQNHPMLILIGGYPGAGKTTLINALARMHDLAVIPWNDIRQSLLDRQIKGSPYDWEIIQAVNHNLMRSCLRQHLNIIIDANAHAANIKLFEDLLEEEQYREIYQIVKICLIPPLDILLSRVRAREQKAGVHQGTEKDVFNDVNAPFKKLNMEDYALIIKNDERVPFEIELNIVNIFLENYLNKH